MEEQMRRLNIGINVHQIEKLMDKKTGNDGRVFYLVKWSNSNDSQNTWEPVENLKGTNGNCEYLIKAFEAERIEEFDHNYGGGVERIANLKIDHETNKRSALVIYKNGEMENFSTKILAKRVPGLLINFYESKIIVEKKSGLGKDARSSTGNWMPKHAGSYAVTRGQKIKTILHTKRNELTETLYGLVEYENGQVEYVPTALLATFVPNLLIEIYEEFLKFLL